MGLSGDSILKGCAILCLLVTSLGHTARLEFDRLHLKSSYPEGNYQ